MYTNENEQYVHNVFSQKLQVKENLFSSNFSEINLIDIFQSIKNGGNHKSTIQKARISNKQESDNLKLKVPAVCFNAKFNGEGFGAKNVSGFSNLIYFDIDFKDNPDLEFAELKSLIGQLPYVVAVWSSFGGKGIGFVCYTNEVQTDVEFKLQHTLLCEIIQTETGCPIKWDKRTAHANRQTALSFDPDIIINQQPIQFQFEEERGAFGSLSIKEKVDTHLNAPPLNQRKYYSENFIDIHNPEMLSAATITYGDGSYLFRNPYWKSHLIGVKGKIPIGQRNKRLFAAFCSFVQLNSHYTNERLYNWLKLRNDMYCEIPLAAAELNRIFTKVLELYNEGALFLNAKKRITVFDSTCKMDKEAKLARVAENKKANNAMKISEAITQLLSTNKIITRKLVSELSGMKERTVVLRWKPYKLLIENHNKKITMKNETPIIQLNAGEKFTGATGHKYAVLTAWVNPKLKIQSEISNEQYSNTPQKRTGNDG